ncbi:ATP-grasp domain-containing protein [Paraburkholderia rhizosphaerae]|uniref:Putative ATP-grasp superfamily ATP-dependent carboligase n=1 Tax=Paraburkholderia rhizosphaerae TaxID=480658 RepID=A0A4R8LZ66_9BURK|nr:ATP-grasp domain-containing protein [Paraburkholderia rhizosphaerae]TDY52151.1 putative ATP-grasp superfamily ATP-dependent carboligase [Paraburkholderia rhizosphaerae]
MIRLFVYEYLTGGGIDPDLAGESGLADLSALIVEGRAMRDAIVQDLRALENVDVSFASSRFEAAAASRSPLSHYCAAPGESMMDFVARAARAHDYAWIVAPECDGLMLKLAEAVGANRWLGCAPEAISIASSKRATSALLAAQGIATTPALDPRMIDTDVARADSHDAAGWVVKPDDGAGGLDTWRYDALSDACAEYRARDASGRNPVLQEWVDGEALSLSLICGGAAGARLLSINRQRIGVSDAASPAHAGHVIAFEGVDIDQIDRRSPQGRMLETLALQTAAALPGLRGFVGIDMVWHPVRGPIVIEVNPRVTMAYVGLSARLGRNLAADVLAAHGVRTSSLQAYHGAASASAPLFVGRTRS